MAPVTLTEQYYLARAQEERKKADNCQHEHRRAMHLELARLLDERATEEHIRWN